WFLQSLSFVFFMDFTAKIDCGSRKPPTVSAEEPYFARLYTTWVNWQRSKKPGDHCEAMTNCTMIARDRRGSESVYPVIAESVVIRR
ncbi:MAG: hypothetical protein SGI77_26320, partial [Pirellulaceae bacterium]|nr:hypothetical protein [Pirellulaceae bacterium]